MKRPFERPSHRLEDTLKMHLREFNCEAGNWK